MVTTWRRFLFDGFKTHAVCAELEEPLLADLRARGAKLRADAPESPNPKTLAEWCLDLGGSAYLHQPYEEFAWAGLRVSVPSEQVALVLRDLGTLRPRAFADGLVYYKLHHWHFAVAMTPAQRDMLISRLAAHLKSAEERSDAFVAAIKRGVRGVN